MREFSRPPWVVLLENHGIITFGSSPTTMKAAKLMPQKSAEILLLRIYRRSNFLTPEGVNRIANQIDEHYRQRTLKHSKSIVINCNRQNEKLISRQIQVPSGAVILVGTKNGHFDANQN